tara:strand:+ start:1080 stop:1316 length:237 start_codon:yes stop_codon:yes gene_type:complete
MANVNKLGAYINKLMTTVLDKEQDDFVVDLAITELNRLKVNIEEFLVKNQKDNSDGIAENKPETEKQLLQEDKNVKDK